MKEYCGEAALYVDPNNFNDIAEKMMLVFKDEQKRKELIQNGKAEIEKFFGKESEDFLLELIANDAKIKSSN